MRQKFTGPQRAAEIPLEFALRGGVREIKQSCVECSKEATEACAQFSGLRLHPGKSATGQKGEEPDESLDAVLGFEASKKAARGSGNNPGQDEMRSAFSQMVQRAALEVHEGFFPRRMHHLEHKSAAVGRKQLEIIVVLARERMRGSLNAEAMKSDARRMGLL